MPQPHPNETPDSENWKFIQRFPDIKEELIPLARNLVTYNEQPYDQNKARILSFLKKSDEEKVKAWSDLWVTITHTLGLAYTSSQDDLLHTTALAEYLASTECVEAFFVYWALRFQFPFAQAKHTEWKQHRKVVQPYIAIVEHLTGLFESSARANEPAFSNTYLTYEEIVLILMKTRLDSADNVKENVNLIRTNRKNNFDYTPLHVAGFDTVENQFADRTRLFFEKIDIFKFDNAQRRVFISDWPHLMRALVFLSYRKEPTLVIDEASRIAYFQSAFDHLDPQPEYLFDAIRSVNDSPDFGSSAFNIATAIHNRLSSEGYYFEINLVESFILSIKTKPFVILSGVSGTGKTALPKAIMRIIENSECRSIAVSPDWTDNSDMLGYFDVDGNFVIGEFTSLVLDANKHLHIPYFIILDEMNLARVEYYFAQVLSIVESRYFDRKLARVDYREYLFNPAVRIRLRTSLKKDVAALAELKLGPNIYIIGTVNIDETTHPFSKKVLDRANVLEINRVNLFEGLNPASTASSVSGIPKPNYFYSGNITNLKELMQDWSLNKEVDLAMEETLRLWIGTLSKFSDILEPLKMNFGFRMRDEVCVYLYQAASMHPSTLISPNWWYPYFDNLLVQKILTRVSGEQGQIESYILRLFNECSGNADAYEQAEVIDADLTDTAYNLIFPSAAKKLQRMMREITTDNKPSTSFWTA